MVTATREPSTRNLDVLEAVYRYGQSWGYPPSFRDVVSLAGLSSTSVAEHHIYRLRDYGLLALEPGRARAVRLTEAGCAALGICSDGVKGVA